jgi:HEXXH motif-containing protein
LDLGLLFATRHIRSLMNAEWRRLSASGVTPRNYSTVRLLKAPGPVLQRRTQGSTTRLGSVRLEWLDDQIAREWWPSHRFATKDAVDWQQLAAVMEEALGLVGQARRLNYAVQRLVRSLHLLNAPGPAFDVSFSEPSLPFSVFLSVPPAGGVSQAVRMAESWIHEAMHLHLTLQERATPLIQTAAESASHYSPWKRQLRPASGVLHAIYVFRVIEQFFLELDDPHTEAHRHGRIRQIRQEISQASLLREAPELTLLGAEFVSQLLSGDSLRLFSETH